MRHVSFVLNFIKKKLYITVSIFEANTVNFSINIDYWQHKTFPASYEGEKLRAGRANSCRFLESSNINSFQNVFLINENAEYLL